MDVLNEFWASVLEWVSRVHGFIVAALEQLERSLQTSNKFSSERHNISLLFKWNFSPLKNEACLFMPWVTSYNNGQRICNFWWSWEQLQVKCKNGVYRGGGSVVGRISLALTVMVFSPNQEGLIAKPDQVMSLSKSNQEMIKVSQLLCYWLKWKRWKDSC